MDTVADLFHRVFAATPAFAERLDGLKALSPEISWYPFRSLDKVHLLSMVAGSHDGLEVRLLGGRPRILDVGTADGDLSFLFESVGCDVVAIDNPPSNYNRCAGVRSMRELVGSNVALLEKDIDYDLAVDGQFDLILMLDILYHLRNPLGTLIGLCQLARHMVITTRIFEAVTDRGPLHDTPCAYLLAPFEAAENDPTNYWIFTERAFSRLLERSGWRIVNRGYFGYTGNDSSPFDRNKDKRVVALCERVNGYDRLKYGHFLARPLDASVLRTRGLEADRGAGGQATDPIAAAVAAGDAAAQRCKALEAELTAERARLGECRRLLRDRDELICTVFASKSWRFTGPLRAVADLVRRSR